MRALLKKKGVISKKGSIAEALLLKPYHEFAKYETFQLIAANYKKLDELDQAVTDAKGSIKLVIENMPAVHSCQKKNKSFKDLDTFISLTPSIEELSKCSSRFYDKINQK